MTTKEIKIEVQSLLEIPLAYGKAIDIFKEPDDEYPEGREIWGGEISLVRIEFQDNFRRQEYVCVFSVTHKH